MLNDKEPLYRYQLITINVPAGSAIREFSFPNQPDLQNAKIQKLSVYHGDLLTKTPDNVAMATSTDICNAYLHLYQGDKEIMVLPLNSLIVIGEPLAAPIYNSNGYIPLDNLQIDFSSKSYVKFTQPYAATAFAIAIGVFYKY